MRRAAKADDNQKSIVDALRSIPGVTVETNHHDILVGYNGFTYWVEIKNPNVVKKSGELSAGALRKSQKRIKAEWCGQYLVAWTLDQILDEIGIKIN